MLSAPVIFRIGTHLVPDCEPLCFTYQNVCLFCISEVPCTIQQLQVCNVISCTAVSHFICLFLPFFYHSVCSGISLLLLELGVVAISYYRVLDCSSSDSELGVRSSLLSLLPFLVSSLYLNTELLGRFHILMFLLALHILKNQLWQHCRGGVS